MRGLIKPSQPALMETWWWKKRLHFCLFISPCTPGVMSRLSWGAPHAWWHWGGTGWMWGHCHQLPAHWLSAPCLGQASQQWDLPPATALLSPFFFRKRVSHGTPISGAGAGLKPSIPHFLSLMMAPGSGLRVSPGLVCLNLRHHVGRLSISPGSEQPCQGWE